MHFSLRELRASIRGGFNTAVLLLKVFPMLHARPVDWVTPRPVVEEFPYPTGHGPAIGQLYRPPGRGPHPGILVCLGVVPFEVDHPQVPRLGESLARAGFTALLYWSPAMRDHRLELADIEDIATAYDALLARADVDERRSGLLGTCVGGAFALMAATDDRIRERVAFVIAYAPYASMRGLARDIASASKIASAGDREPWAVDPLTRKVYLHTVTASLQPDEAHHLRERYAERTEMLPGDSLSAEGQRLAPLLTALDPVTADEALDDLPPEIRQRLDALSPVTYIDRLAAPLLVLLHDRDDPVIPVGESHALRDALAARRPVRYTEFTVFTHLDPTRSGASKLRLGRELLRFAAAIYPALRVAAGGNAIALPPTTPAR